MLAMAPDLPMLGAFSLLHVCVYALGNLFVSRAAALDIQRRKLSWILTTFAALVTTIIGVQFALIAWQQGVTGEVEQLYSPLEPMAWLTPGHHLSGGSSTQQLQQPEAVSRALTLFFLAYCIMDTLIGALHYPDQIDIGFVHHGFYAILLCYLLHTRQTLLFAVCGVEELPTLIVGAAHLYGDVASNPRFSVGVLFFLTRVSYHTWVSVRAIDSLNPLLYWVSSVVLVQHISWFQAFMAKGTLPSKRLDERQAPGKAGAEAGAGATEAAVDEGALWAVASRNLVAFMLIIAGQAVLHAALTIAVVRAALGAPGWGDGALPFITGREWLGAAAWAVYILVGHLLVLYYTVRRLVRTLRDVYAASFIDGAISARRIIYNISWEDPAIERARLGIGTSDAILTISSAGCNVLDYLLQSPRAIVACDLNVAQLAILDLKLACIATLEHAPYFALWARSDVAVFDEWYVPTLRPALTLDSSRTFWDANGHALFAANFFFAGTSGFAARLARAGMRACGVLGRVSDAMRRHAPPNVQSLGMRAVAAALSQMWLWRWLAPLGGVPLSQIDLLRRRPAVWIERVLEVLHTRMWREGNYFYHAYAVGEWTDKCCPRYLQPEHYATLRTNARRVTLHHGPLADAAKLRDDFTVASLLDSMDWMGDAQIAEQLAALLPRMAAHGRLFWRSFGLAIHSPVLAQLRPELIDDYDRVGWYLSSWVAAVPTAAAPPSADGGSAVTADFGRFLRRGTDYAPSNSLWDDAYICACMAHHALRSEKDVVAFYRAQVRAGTAPALDRGGPPHPAPTARLACGPHAAHMLLACGPHAAHMLLACGPHATRMRPTCGPHAAHMLLACGPHAPPTAPPICASMRSDSPPPPKCSPKCAYDCAPPTTPLMYAPPICAPHMRPDESPAPCEVYTRYTLLTRWSMPPGCHPARRRRARATTAFARRCSQGASSCSATRCPGTRRRARGSRSDAGPRATSNMCWAMSRRARPLCGSSTSPPTSSRSRAAALRDSASPRPCTSSLATSPTRRRASASPSPARSTWSPARTASR